MEVDDNKPKPEEVVEPGKDMPAEELKRNEQPGLGKTKSKPKVRWWLWLILIVVIVATGGYLAYARYSEQISEYLFGSDPSSSNSTANTSDNTANTSTESEVEKIVDAGVTWKTPVKLGDLGLFENNPSFEGIGGYQGTTYYLVGTTSTGAEIIVAEVSAWDAEIHRFLKKDGAYTRLTKNSHEISSEGEYITNFKSDSSFYFKSLSPDSTITKGETDLSYYADGPITLVSGYDSGTKVATTKWGDLKVEKGADAGDSNGNVKIARYYILLNDSTKAYYNVSPTFMLDDGTLKATFVDSSKKTTAFDKVKTSACGGGSATFPMVAAVSATSGEVEVASTNDSKIYSFTNSTNPLVVYVYGYYNSGQSSVKPISQFVSDLGTIVWTDDYGSTIVFSNRDYAPLAECGKPVIYLYPAETTEVSVKVGADITQSEPAYNSGWQVTASPLGKLTTSDGSLFDYLFWEGFGKGEYPQITTGTVVAASDAVQKIKTDLSTIGLNSKEIADFVEFWGPKLPTSGSVRLTWLTNDEMNKLAPLSVSPKPDSVIRVFLDFASVNGGAAITPQTLPTYARNGFTLVEWGGLLKK